MMKRIDKEDWRYRRTENTSKSYSIFYLHRYDSTMNNWPNPNVYISIITILCWIFNNNGNLLLLVRLYSQYWIERFTYSSFHSNVMRKCYEKYNSNSVLHSKEMCKRNVQKTTCWIHLNNVHCKFHVHGRQCINIYEPILLNRILDTNFERDIRV